MMFSTKCTKKSSRLATSAWCSPNERYESLARTDVPSFLVCASTLKDDGTATDPFLLVVSFPTTFRKEFTRKSIWGGTKPAMLEPGNVQEGHEMFGPKTRETRARYEPMSAPLSAILATIR